MNQRQRTADGVAAQIDRLVSDDLAESDRRSLLAWLDEEPARWRTCGIAFLEAQAWQAAADWGVGDRDRESGIGSRDTGVGPLTTHRSPPSKHQTHSANRLLHWLVLAGVVLTAFAIGLVSGRRQSAAPQQSQFASPAPTGRVLPGDASEPLVATVSVRTNLDPRVPAELRLPIAAGAATSAAEPAVSEYVRQQWERRGFELSEEVRYLPAKLSDGREVMVPVKKVHLKFKGTPVS